jgi:hypothetical protein
MCYNLHSGGGIMSNERRKNKNTTLDEELYFKIKLISWNMSRPNHQVYINELIEEGMKYIIDKYERYIPEEYKKKAE